MKFELFGQRVHIYISLYSGLSKSGTVCVLTICKMGTKMVLSLRSTEKAHGVSGCAHACELKAADVIQCASPARQQQHRACYVEVCCVPRTFMKKSVNECNKKEILNSPVSQGRILFCSLTWSSLPCPV